MGRPLKAAVTQTANGRFRTSLPVATGAKKRKSRTFDTMAEALAWNAAGVEALAEGRPLPEPRTLAAEAQVERVAEGLPGPGARQVNQPMTLREGADIWHRIRYDLNHAAQPERSSDVRADLDNHILAFFEGATLDGYVSGALDGITVEFVAQFARWLGGWPCAVDFLDDLPSPRLQRSTAKNVMGTLRQVLAHAVNDGWIATNPAKSVQAMERNPKAQPRRESQPREFRPLEDVASVAAHLSPVHQATLWILRALGLRLGESFGPLVRDLLSIGDGYGLLLVAAQGGRYFDVRDDDGVVVTTTRKEALKRKASVRALVVPRELMELLEQIIEIFHTDPTSGEVDLGARLVPCVGSEGQSQGDFRKALAEACAMAGIERAIPKEMRSSYATDLQWEIEIDDVTRRRMMGHRHGEDVYLRDYVQDDRKRRSMLEAARQIDEQLIETVGSSLMLTTSVVQDLPRGMDADRAEYILAQLFSTGWTVDAAAEQGDWLDPRQVAAVLGIGHTTARRHMREGRIPSQLRAWGEREVWVARRADVEASKEKAEQLLTLAGLAAEVGYPYHRARDILHRLGLAPTTRDGSRQLLVTEEHRAALMGERERLLELHRRAMPLAEAAKLLGKSERTARDWANNGKLELDPESDGGNARFVTRRSVDQLRGLPTLVGGSAAISEADFRDITGLGRVAVSAMFDAGLVDAVPTGRGRAVTLDSAIAWAKGYRPDLLDRLTVS